MTQGGDELWDRLMRRTRPPTADEIARELENISEEPLSDEDRAAILRAARSGSIKPSRPEPRLAWVSAEEILRAEEQAPVLNRNLGETEPDVEALLDEHRRKALVDDDEDDEENGPDDVEET